MHSATQKRVVKIAGIVILLIIIFWGILLIMGTVASRGDTIYPNVTVNNQSVGGMTVYEAENTLSASASQDNDKSITITFKDGSTAEVSAREAGLSIVAGDAAELAYDYGRNKGLFSNSIAYFKCLIGMGSVELSGEVDRTLDEQALRDQLTTIAAEHAVSRTDPSYEISDKTLVMTKGSYGMSVDADALYESVSAAMLSGDFSGINFESELLEPGDMDIQAVYDEIYQEPKNSVYDTASGSVTEDQQGVSFDIEEAQVQLDMVGEGAQAKVALVYTQPDITAEYLKGVLFSSRLSSKSTELTSNSNRNTNIELSAKAINGTVINPGEQFSFNDIVGERTEARGYMAAGAYSNGQSITEVGGGICQVSSTIYYCVLMSNLEVVSRLPHSFTVSYLPLGMDAAVSWGGPQFTFANNTDYPIKLMTWRDGLTLHVEIYGTKTNENTYELSSETIGTTDYQTVYEDDSSMPAGSTTVMSSGKPGYTVETYRYTYDSAGSLIKTEHVNTSTYSAMNQVVKRGTGTGSG